MESPCLASPRMRSQGTCLFLNVHFPPLMCVGKSSKVSTPRGPYPSACRNVHAKKSVRPTELALFTHFAVHAPVSNHIIWQGIGKHKRAAVHGKNSLNQQTQKKAHSSWKATGANAKSHGNDNWAWHSIWKQGLDQNVQTTSTKTRPSRLCACHKLSYTKPIGPVNQTTPHISSPTLQGAHRCIHAP